MMFRRSRVIVFVAVVSMALFSMTCCTRNNDDDGFVYIEDGVFKLKGKDFFPLMLNYKISLMAFGDDLVIGAAKDYDEPGVFEPTTKEEALDQFYGHMQLTKELGFNTVRLCLNVISTDDNGNYFTVQNGKVYLKDKASQIIDAAEEMINIAALCHLRVMLLLKPSWDEELAEFNGALMRCLADNPAIFAYDLMNEPLYFDIVRDRLKSDAVQTATKWVNAAKEADPNHLVTIGFAEPLEVFSWDPSVMPLDFVEIHTYNPLSIPNETWWFSHYVGKPWMIGETSLPADNDSVSYEQQRLFAKQAYKYARGCGAIGFGWWAFQDYSKSDDVNFEGIYSGILNHEGTTTTKDGHVIKGTLKPVAHSFKRLKPWKKSKARKAINYYNNFGYHNAIVRGRVVNDSTGEPIEGAVVRGWNVNWSTGLNTFTDENGVFNLYSNDECVYYAISAPGMDTKRLKDIYLDYRDINGELAEFDTLPDKRIKSSMVSYGKFLKNKNRLFKFKKGEFDKAVIFADLGEIRLKMLENE